MSVYHYPLLSRPDSSIRLLQLLPRREDPKNLRCKIFEFPLQNSDEGSRPYEALSYHWGGEQKTESIIIVDHQEGKRGNQKLAITLNLYEALLQLQDQDLPRIIWADGVCIDQSNMQEKEAQIPLMAEIYAKASQVIVWLGKAKDGSNEAIKAICDAAEGSVNLSKTQLLAQAISALLERPWFSRIWVLQEVAAARHVLIKCGSREIDGHAFCLGVDLKNDFITQVKFLIRRAIFRSRHMPKRQGGLLLNIGSLGELIDMYHSHKATRLHDKVYALLGMCLDDPSATRLKPNYSLSWKKLIRHAVKFVLGDYASVSTWKDKETAVINIKGCVLGSVSAVETDDNISGEQTLEATFNNMPKQLGYIRNGDARWTFPTSAKLIQQRDVICLFQGALKPSIIRLREDHFAVVMISAVPPKHIHTGISTIKWQELVQSVNFTRDFLLVWDWRISSEEFQDPGKYNDYMRTNRLQLDVNTGLKHRLNNATKIWYISLILGDVGEYEKAEERLQEAVGEYEKIIGEEHGRIIKSQYGLTPLCWAAGNGYSGIVNLLITKDDIDIELKDSQYGQTPLSWAAMNGHEAVVKLLLETGKVEVDSKDYNGRTPLSRAANNGHEAVVKMLLETGKVEVDSKDYDRRTPLSWAADSGHEAMVKELLETGKVEVDSQDSYRRTPLSWAANNGHEAVVEELLETGKVEVDLKDIHGQTPLSWAAMSGQEAVARLLLGTGKAGVDSRDSRERTPLCLAAWGGHGVVVKLLLETGKVEVNSKDCNGRTPLTWAAYSGHEAVVKELLETGKVEVDSKDSDGQTPLFWAAENGQEAVVKLLLETGKVEVNVKDSGERTPLWWAVRNRHKAVVKLLLETDKVEVDSKDSNGQTPLFRAVEIGHEAMIKLLLETGKAKVDSKDSNGQTPLSWAAMSGQDTLTNLMLVIGKVEVDSKDPSA